MRVASTNEIKAGINFAFGASGALPETGKKYVSFSCYNKFVLKINQLNFFGIFMIVSITLDRERP